MALFRFEDMGEAYNRIVSAEDNDEKRVSYERGSLDLPFEFDMFTISRFATMPPPNKPIVDFFEEGRNRADNKIFAAIKGWFCYPLHP